MRKKDTKWRVGWSLVVVLALLMSLAGGSVPTEKVAASSEAASVFLDPPSQTVEVDKTTTVQIRIKNVSNLYGAEVHLAFDKNLLEVVDKDGAKDGTQIAPSTDFFAFTPGQYFVHSAEIGGYFIARAEADNAAGTISYVFTLLAPASPVSVGPEGKVLATITFERIGEGTANIDFVNPREGEPPVKLADAAASPIIILPENVHGAVIEAIAGTPIVGLTREANTSILGGVTITLYKDDAVKAVVISDAKGSYEIIATDPGVYKVVASKAGFKDETTTVSISEKDFGTEITLNFEGKLGLVPKAVELSYLLKCSSLYLFPPVKQPEWGLALSDLLSVSSSYLFPIRE